MRAVHPSPAPGGGGTPRARQRAPGAAVCRRRRCVALAHGREAHARRRAALGQCVDVPPAPLPARSWHMLFCSAVAFLMVRVLKVVKSVNMPQRDYVRRVMPIGALYAASLWLSNSAYLHLSVSFIQMTKALMPGLVYMTVRARVAAFATRGRGMTRARRRACTWARSSSRTSPPPSWCSSPSAWCVRGARARSDTQPFTSPRAGHCRVRRAELRGHRRGAAAERAGVRGDAADAGAAADEQPGVHAEPHPVALLRLARLPAVPHGALPGAGVPRHAQQRRVAAAAARDAGQRGDGVLPQPRGLPPHRQNQRADHEHRGRHQGLDAHLVRARRGAGAWRRQRA